ncbi:non-homologous end-joining DNA ligase [Terrilactibacillus laevilacticus]|uniref:non-homologous end-joining DNA ligase n=1 Tax=Terrilactibacillus laevilacticus TaxID=1380157 RepID=UPI00114771F4|nr:non-homologous end-joining DNA ligase [Terrilactibacillus laevilacticus]
MCSLKPFSPMMPTLSHSIPNDSDWLYEPKYDGYRMQVLWQSENDIRFFSRRLRDITSQFPDLMMHFKYVSDLFLPFLPLVLDGECCILKSAFKADFSSIQSRGQAKSKVTIDSLCKKKPASYVIFDVLYQNGKDLRPFSLLKRHEIINHLSITTLNETTSPLQGIYKIKFFSDSDKLWDLILKHHGEGLVSKKKNSKWLQGKRTRSWIKVKNKQYGIFILTAYNKENDYFQVGLVKNKNVVSVGSFTHGLNEMERKALKTTVKNHTIKEDKTYLYINPGLCIELSFLEWTKEGFREPRFESFQMDKNWEDCKWDKIMRNNKS